MYNYKYKIQRWTQSAIDCYQRGCICEGCPIYELIFKNRGYKCQMKAAVIESVRIFGAPPTTEEKGEING